MVWLGLSYSDRIVWYLWPVIGFGLFAIVRQLLPRPWPDCPACGRGFNSLGHYCPNCGGELDRDTRGSRASCLNCEKEMRVTYWSKAPVRQYYASTEDVGGPAQLTYEFVPIRYCMHCRARLGD